MRRDLAILLDNCRIQLVVVAVLVLLIVGCWVGLTWFSEPQVEYLQARQLQLQQQIRQRQLEFARTGVPVSVRERLENNARVFKELIPPIDRFSGFVGELFDLAEKAGLPIHQISYHPEHDAASGYLRYGLNFSVDGDYPEIKKFLYLLENTERILIIQKISVVGRSPEKGSSGGVSLTIDLATFFREKST